MDDIDNIDDEDGFLKNLDTEDYPSVLQITSNPEDVHRQDVLDRIERWREGEDPPHVINFQNPKNLLALLTDLRIDILKFILIEQPDSVQRVADRFNRDVESIRDDLQVLIGHDIVHIEQNDREKRPFVPYDSIEIDVNLEIPASNPDTSDEDDTKMQESLKWTTERDRMKSIVLADGEPRSARGIAEEAIVAADRTREILSDLVEDGVVAMAERNGETRYAADRDHIRREAVRMLEEVDSRDDLRDLELSMLERLIGIEDPVHERLITYNLKIVSEALSLSSDE